MIMLPVSLDCPLLIAPSIFSNVYSFTELCQSLPELSFLSRRAYGTIILIEIDFFFTLLSTFREITPDIILESQTEMCKCFID
jgi:hypothetical protein